MNAEGFGDWDDQEEARRNGDLHDAVNDDDDDDDDLIFAAPSHSTSRRNKRQRIASSTDGISRTVVLHVDADSFFLQVELARRGLRPVVPEDLERQPACVQQHQDTIALNTKAKSLGIKKHSLPAEARNLLRQNGGAQYHVFTLPSGRVSYRPYREASERLHETIKAQFPGCEYEVASMDEAFVEIGCDDDDEALRERIQAVRATCFERTGFVVSAGVGQNKLLAKFASAAAKPNGMKLVLNRRDEQQLLENTPSWRIPGLGRKKHLLLDAGCQTVADMQAIAPLKLAQIIGEQENTAAAYCTQSHGMDDRLVRQRGPPLSLAANTSLTPDLRVSCNSEGDPHFLRPVAASNRKSLGVFMEEMCEELLLRAAQHRRNHGQVPQTLTLGHRRRESTEAFKSMPFPALALPQYNAKTVAPRTLSCLMNACFLLLAQLTSDEPQTILTRVSIVFTNFTKSVKDMHRIESFFGPAAAAVGRPAVSKALLDSQPHCEDPQPHHAKEEGTTKPDRGPGADSDSSLRGAWGDAAANTANMHLSDGHSNMEDVGIWTAIAAGSKAAPSKADASDHADGQHTGPCGAASTGDEGDEKDDDNDACDAFTDDPLLDEQPLWLVSHLAASEHQEPQS
eukprot:m.108755 g.108755  ORF g.108755 m.108755 type:complete len:625 (-) comp15935_c0_seq5:1464-3338(-)